MTKLYYEEPGVKIFHGDALEVVKQFPDALVVTDPPYNVGYHYKEFEDNLNNEEYFKRLIQILGDNFIVLHYIEEIFELAIRTKKIPNKVVAWVYPSNIPKQWRGIAWFGDSKPDFSKATQPYKNPNDKRIKQYLATSNKDGARLYDWWEINQIKNTSKEKTEHPCQIPFEVMDRIIKVTSPKLVIDPFCGSGTTLAACKKNGVPCIGVDLVEDYCKISKRTVINVMEPLDA